jgi:anti-sigma B factor antagonist
VKTARIKRLLPPTNFPAMKFTHETNGNVFILRLSGDLIGENSGANILESVSNSIQQNVLNCIVDISQLRYINSSGIGVLITILTKFRNKGGEVYLMNPSENVQKLLVITKLNAIFQIVKSEADVEKLIKK